MRSSLVVACVVGSILISPSLKSAAVTGRKLESPLRFEPNVGQAAPAVGFVGHGPGYTVLIKQTEFALYVAANRAQSERRLIRFRLDGGDRLAIAEGLDRLSSVTNYYGPAKSVKPQSGVLNFGKVALRKVYPGIDLVYYPTKGNLEYDFILAPGSDPESIRLTVDASEVKLSPEGDLLVRSGSGWIRQRRPRAYQQISGRQYEIPSVYQLKAGGVVGFEIGTYDHSRPLTIDPVLEVSTFSGFDGGTERTLQFAVDSMGNTYVAEPGPGSATMADEAGLDADVAIAKHSSSGKLLYTTYLGGSGNDFALGIAADTAGRLVICGSTVGGDLQPTARAYAPPSRGEEDAWVARLDPEGKVEFLAVLGGIGSDQANAVTLDRDGNIWIAGQTASIDFPTTLASEDAPAPGTPDAFVAQLSRDGRDLLFSRRIGGTGSDRALAIALDGAGRVIIAGVTSGADFPTTEGAFSRAPGGGDDAFVVQLNQRGDRLRFSTLLGGSGDDAAYALAIGPEGSVYVAGGTTSPGFPASTADRQVSLNGGEDAFVVQFDPLASQVVYAALIGGQGFDRAYSIVVDMFDNAYVTGLWSESATPRQKRVYMHSPFVAKLDPAGELLYAAPVGTERAGAGTGLFLPGDGSLVVAGYFGSPLPGSPSESFEDTLSSETFIARANLTDPLCPLKVSPSVTDVSAGGGSVQINVFAPPSCSWTVSTNATWIHVTGRGDGMGTILLYVEASIEERVGIVTVGDQRIRINQSTAATVSALGPQSFAAYKLYAVNGATPAAGQHPASTLHTLNPNNGALLSTIGSTAYQIVGLAFRPTDGVLFGVTANQASLPQRLVTIDPATGAVTALVSANAMGAAIHDLAFDGTDLYGWGGSHGAGSSGERLYKINTTNGTIQTPVSGSFLLSAGAGLALSPNGSLYQVGPTGSTLNTINKTSGTVTPGPTLSGSSDFRFLGLEFSPGGELFGVTRPGTLQVFDQATKLAVVNPLSGQITYKGNTGIGNVSAIAFQSCIGSVAPTSFSNSPLTGAILSSTITVPAGCFWTIASDVNWITPSVASGSGGAIVGLTVAANIGAPRTGTVTVAGEIVTISQAGVANSCPATVLPSSLNAGAVAATQLETISIAAGCSWTSISNATWISLQGATTGTGNGTVTLSFSANTGPPRTGTVTIAGLTVTVNQQSPSNACPTALFPTALTAGPSGAASYSVQVTNQIGCSWVTSSNAGWLTIITGANGTGRGAVTFNIAANNGAARVGTLNIAGQLFQVDQQGAGGPCFATLSAAGAFLVNGIGSAPSALSGAIAVNTQPGCVWSTTNSVPWITISNGASTGNGSMTFVASVNSGPPRVGAFIVAGWEFTVYQEGLISSTLYGANGTPRVDFTTPPSTLYTLNPSNGASLTTLGPTGFTTNGLAVHPVTGDLYATTGRLGQSPNTLLKLNRLTGAGVVVGALGTSVHELAFDSDGTLYGWGATSNGGNYDLHRIDPTTGVAARVGPSGISLGVFGAGLTFDLADDLFYGNQLSLSQNFFKVNKSTGALTPQTSLIGSDFKVVAMDLLPSGSILVLTHQQTDRSQIANLSQLNRTNGALVPIGRTIDYLNGIAALNCVGAVSPDKQQVSGTGGILGSGVVISGPCDWSAQSNAPWINFVQASGKGSSALMYTVAGNPGSPRLGTVSVAGQTITISQDGAVNACPASLVPPAQTVSPGAGGTSVQVTVANGCLWSAVSNATWITVTNSANQSGLGAVALQFTVNSGTPRTGTVTIAGQTFTITQQSAVNFCPATIQPATQTVSPTGGNTSVGVAVSTSCSWTATTTLPWVTISSGTSGAGNGTVVLSVTPYTGTVDRSGTVEIAGQSYAITQRSPINFCPAMLAPVSQQVPVSGGAFQVGVAVPAGCQWTAAVSGVSWATVTGPLSGTGTGITNYAVAANSGYPRTGTLNIAGQLLRLSQAGPLSGSLYVATGGGGGADARLYQIEPSTGNVIADIGSIGYPVTGLAFHPVTRQLYASTNNRNAQNGRKLLRINRTTAAATEIGNLALTDGSLHDLAFDSSGNLYAVSSQRNQNDLYRVDINNAALTRVGEAYPFQVPGDALAFGQGGTLFYGARAAPQNPGDPRSFLNTLDPSTGTMTPKVQVSGRSLGEKFSGFDLDAYGTMYGFVLPEQFATPSNLITIDTTDGVITTIGKTIDNANSLAFYPTSCAFYVTPGRAIVPLNGGGVTVNVTAAAECPWSVTGNDPWLQVSTLSGAGNGSITITAPPNSLSRTGSVIVAGSTIQITQTNGTAALPSKVGVFRSGFFWLQDVDGNQQFNVPPDRAFAFGGVPGDIPISGDWNGSGTTKVGVYRPSNGLFVLDYDGDGQFTAADKAYNLGVGTQAGDVPVVGDWNGDGKTKVGLFRQGFFWILDYNGNGVFEQANDKTFAFGGVAGDVPVVGDWSGDGKTKIGLLRQGFFWILDYNGNGTVDNVNQAGGDKAFAFGGIAGDVPVVGDWNGDGKSKVGMFRAGFFWVLDGNGNYQFDGTGAGQDLAFPFGGISGDRPVVGKW